MGKVRVICVNGLSRSGKDSFIRFVKDRAYSVTHSTIDTVKSALIETGMLHPFNKTEKERAFLTAVKQAWIEYSDGPFKEVLEKVKDIERTYKFMNNIDHVFLFVQVREPSEMMKLAKHFWDSITTVLVERTGIEVQPGDEDVYEWNYDFFVKNDGSLEDLEKEADRFINFTNEVF